MMRIEIRRATAAENGKVALAAVKVGLPV